MSPRDEHTTGLNRRDFLRSLAVTALVTVVGKGNFDSIFVQDRPFNFLVVGDSLIWGQGLDEKDKFYSLTAEWLRNTAFGARRAVDLKVKAHSGSTLKFHPKEAEKYQKIGRDETYPFKPEVNVGFPSSWKQIEVAADEYKMAGVVGADLVMISGGITDITTSRVYDPKGDDDLLRTEIKKYCGDDMFDVLEHAIAKNPNAKLVVIGYFNSITEHSSSSKLLNAWLEALSFPRAFKFIANNPIARPLFFNKLRKGAMRRSRIWKEESDRHFADAVGRINAKHGSGRAVFIPSPLTDEHAAEAPKTKLFTMGKGGVVKDARARERIRDCRDALPKLKKETTIDYPVRLCEVAAIGHPDPAGSRMYADAIATKLKNWVL